MPNEANLMSYGPKIPNSFYPREGASDARVLAVVVCMCVCLSVCLSDITLNINSFHQLNPLVIISVSVDTASPSLLIPSEFVRRNFMNRMLFNKYSSAVAHKPTRRAASQQTTKF